REGGRTLGDHHRELVGDLLTGRTFRARPARLWLFIPVLCASAASAQIVVTKAPTAPVITSGDPVSYLIEVVNTSTTTTAVGTIPDPLPAGATWTQPPGCTLDPGTRALTCDFAASPHDGAAVVSVSGIHTAGLCANLVNTASATSNLGGGSSGAAVITVLCP